MKKPLIYLCLITLLLTACGNELGAKVPDMPEEMKVTYIETIEESLEELKDGNDSLSTYLNIAFAYQMLDEYEDAIEYYEKALELDVNNYQALNNLADIYQDEEDFEMAAEYIKRLYENNTSSAQVISKTVEILMQADQSENALQALENFARMTSGEDTHQDLISRLYEEIKQTP